MSNPASVVGLLNQFVQCAEQLYTLPAVAMKVLELTKEDQLDTWTLKNCIEQDPALSAKLLRVVNSSLFGLGSPVADLHQALTLLGTKPLKILVLGFSLPPNLFKGLEADILQRYWRHTLIKATAARELSRKLWHRSGDEAFLAGLLQDVGMLVLIQQLGESYQSFLEKVDREQRKVSTMEIATLGFCHTSLSQRLLECWRLPSTLSEAIGEPAEVDRLLALPAERQELPQTLHLAELVATLLTRRDPAALQELTTAGQSYQDLSTDQLHQLIDDLVGLVPQLAEVLSIQIADHDYLEILREAQSQLSQTAEQMLLLPTENILHEPELRNLCATVARWEQPGDGQPDETAVGVATLAQDLPLQGRVATAVAACRLSRTALSLLLVEIDAFRERSLTLGVDAAGMLVQKLEEGIGKLDQRPLTCLEVADGRLAVILPGCDRSWALELGRQLISEVPLWLGQGVTGNPKAVVTLSAGLATVPLPPRNFPAEALIEAAERYLYGAQTSGGVIKSIDV